jgi:hypothetical protein
MQLVHGDEVVSRNLSGVGAGVGPLADEEDRRTVGSSERGNSVHHCVRRGRRVGPSLAPPEARCPDAGRFATMSP